MWLSWHYYQVIINEPLLDFEKILWPSAIGLSKDTDISEKGVFRTTNQKYKIKIKKKSKKLGWPSIKINYMQIQNANVKMRPKYAKITLKLFFH